ncbi:hypothetical protein CROQUDRAFT_44650, partial [Cronartium quercuum f. sp. fusiforme G11]
LIECRRQPTGKVVLYNSHSNQLSIFAGREDDEVEIQSTSDSRTLINEDRVITRYQPSTFCPLCHQPLNLSSSNSAPPRSHEPHSRQYTPPAQAVNSLRALLPPDESLNDYESQSQWVQRPDRTIIDASYFRLLSRTSTPQASRPVTPPPIAGPSNISSRFSHTSPRVHEEHTRSSVHIIDHEEEEEPLGDAYRVDGYYERFFVEDVKLGRGEKGSVFLCTHVLYGHSVGHFAIKKIAVGQSGPELLRVLREVKCLETLRHQNITQYHHSWIEKAQLSRFGPPVPVLFILMDYANGGTLDGYIDTRKGTRTARNVANLASAGLRPSKDSQDVDDAERRHLEKEQFRRRRNAHHPFGSRDQPESAEAAASGPAQNVQRIKLSHSTSTNTLRHDTTAPGFQERFRALNDDVGLAAIHLLSLEEILSIFRDTCNGLAFLHSQGILHHDLKTENVLLHWEHEDSMIPKALISDFGSSITQSENWRRERSTLDWVPPESLKKDPRTGRLYEVTQSGDMWQLGLVLHSLCFFRLPYTESDNIDKLREEIQQYPGYMLPMPPKHAGFSKSSLPPRNQPAHRLDLPRSLLKLMADLLSVEAFSRPSCATVLTCIENIRESNLAAPSGSLANSSTRQATKRQGASYVDQSIITTGRVQASNLAASTSHNKSGQLTVIKRRGTLEFSLSDEQQPVTTSFRDQNSNQKHRENAQKSGLSSARSWSTESRISPRRFRRVQAWALPEAHSQKQICVGILVIMKSALFLSIPNPFLDGTSGMLTLTIMNVMELIFCNWRVTALLSMGQMLFLITSITNKLHLF